MDKKALAALIAIGGVGFYFWYRSRSEDVIEPEYVHPEDDLGPFEEIITQDIHINVVEQVAQQAAEEATQAVLEAQEAEKAALLAAHEEATLAAEQEAHRLEMELIETITDKRTLYDMLAIEDDPDMKAVLVAQIEELKAIEREEQAAAAAAADAAREEREALITQWNTALDAAEVAVKDARASLSTATSAYWSAHAVLHDPMPVIAYEHDDYKGAWREFVADMPDAQKDLDIYADRGIKQNNISSIVIKPGYKVIAWEHPYMGGRSIIIDRTWAMLNRAPWPHDNWGDRISSLQVDDSEIREKFDTVRHNLVVVKSHCNDVIERALTIEADIRLLNILGTRIDYLKSITVALRDAVSGLPV